MSEGWIIAHRNLFDPGHHLGGDVACKRYAWLDLISLAAYEPYDRPIKMDLIRLERGEFLASFRYLAARWGWSKNKVASYFRLILNRIQIETVRGTPHGTVYRIVNYDTYQKPWDSERDTFRDADGTAKGQPRDKEKEVNTFNAFNAGKEDAQGRIFPEEEIDVSGNGILKPNELLGEWIDRQTSPPDKSEKVKQAGKAKQLCTKHSRNDIVKAFHGMNQLFPYSDGTPWDLFDLDRLFSKAKEAVVNHPGIKAMKRRQELEEELGDL